MSQRLLLIACIFLLLPFSVLAAPPEQPPASMVQRPSAAIFQNLPEFRKIATGGNHTCALSIAGGVKCWGDNEYGQLGDGTTIEQRTPVDVIGLASGVSALAAGWEHTCALTIAGGVKCWGYNVNGQLGDGTTTERHMPVDVVGLTSGVTALAAGSRHTCALTTAGGVKCWGWNGGGQLGDGSIAPHTAPMDVVGLTSGATALAAGDRHTCALTIAGGAKCWGWNYYGQLGDGTTTNQHVPVDVVGLTGVVAALVAGNAHTCALVDNDSFGSDAKCWGWNYYGQLGDGTTISRRTPMDVIGLASGVTALAAGGVYTCALMTAASSSGGAKCWGYNHSGQLGDGTTVDRHTPVDVAGLTNGVIALAASQNHTCALTITGGAKCWGLNYYGQLGDGTRFRYSIPLDVMGVDIGMTMLAAGSWHTCGLTTAGSAGSAVKCWGSNSYGQLGDGTTVDQHTPVDVVGLPNGVTALAAGWGHTCALTSGRGVKCWGWNYYGQLGDGTTTERHTPVDVVGLASGVTALAAGMEHTCALTIASGVKCWGSNSYGQLGDGTTTERHTPVDVVGLTSGVVALAAGSGHTCALLSDSRMKCWGNDSDGQLGDGETDQRSVPVDVIGLADGVTALAAGGSHTCALTTGGSSGGGVMCWGNNENGQLGDGTTINSSIPVDVIDLVNGASGLVAGGRHTCALTNAGSSGHGVKCWGNNEDGQLGDGTTTNRSMPIDVIGLLGGGMALTTGDWHTCGLVTGGWPKCWGNNQVGQLGIGVGGSDIKPIPVDVVEGIPQIRLNYASGRPGSFFTVSGENFPSNGIVTLSVNQQILTDTLQATPMGGFIVFLDTSRTNPGTYIVKAHATLGAAATFILQADDPLRVQEGGGITFEINTSPFSPVFLPLMVRDVATSFNPP